MEKITLHETLPEVFAQRTGVVSEIWHRHVELERGKTYLIEANSGTGKSSLCSFVYGYRHDYQGTISFDGQDVRLLTLRQWVNVRQRHVALLWQDLRLFPELTAWENVQIKNKLTGCQKSSRIKQWLEQLGISDKREELVARMSFGQQQRVALVRALCQPFEFILLDEPISHLDESNSQLMASILMEEARRQGAAVVVTSIGKRLNLAYDHVFKL